MSIAVMIVDDHKMIREGLRKVLEFNGDIKVVAEANNGKECLKVLRETLPKPDVILLDINMPGMNGIDTLQTLKKRRMKSKILLLTVHNEIEYVIRAIELGINGYILKDADSKEIKKGTHFILPYNYGFAEFTGKMELIISYL